jgi:hypothetical protein
MTILTKIAVYKQTLINALSCACRSHHETGLVSIEEGLLSLSLTAKKDATPRSKASSDLPSPGFEEDDS